VREREREKQFKARNRLEVPESLELFREFRASIRLVGNFPHSAIMKLHRDGHLVSTWIEYSISDSAIAGADLASGTGASGEESRFRGNAMHIGGMKYSRIVSERERAYLRLFGNVGFAVGALRARKWHECRLVTGVL